MSEGWFLYMSNNFFHYFKGRVATLRRVERNDEGYYNIEDVINWFLSRSSMSPKKLQKLLYYAYAWTLTLGNESADSLSNRLFKERFEAWVHGPVVPKVYQTFKPFGFTNIPIVEDNLVVFDEEVEDVLNQVWEVYGDYNGNELESMTHQEDPWVNAREGLSPIESSRKIISDIDIFNFYLNEMIEANE